MRFSLSQALIATLVIQMTGCASTQESERKPAVVEGPVLYTVEQDDRLGDIAYAITGSTDNWVAIAEHNNVKDARKIRVGDVLEIPITLIRDSRSDPQSESSVLAVNTVGSRQAKSDNPETLPASTASTKERLVRAPDTSYSSSNLEGDVDVVLNPVNINRQFQLNETDAEIISDTAAIASSAKIRIVGTYFPKGIYEQPTQSAKLITRVAPGTTFDLDADLDGWFRIKFGDGVAFLREIDGKIFFPDKPEILRSAEANE